MFDKTRAYIKQTDLWKGICDSWSQPTNWGMSYSETRAMFNAQKPVVDESLPLDLMTFEYFWAWSGSRFVRVANPEIKGTVMKAAKSVHTFYMIKDILEKVVPGTSYESDINLQKYVESSR